MMIGGPTGVGKSAIVRQTVQDISDSACVWQSGQDLLDNGGLAVINDWGLIDLRVSLLEPSDLLGLPDLSGRVVRWVVPSQLPVIGQEDRFPEQGIITGWPGSILGSRHPRAADQPDQRSLPAHGLVRGPGRRARE